jgi:hypothetical protein
MVYFCLATGFSPEQYRKLTVAEYAKFCEVLEERNG